MLPFLLQDIIAIVLVDGKGVGGKLWTREMEMER
jgi:hypothetical protein